MVYPLQAEAWLQEQAQKEGWSKATKLKGRTTAQGLIGVMRNKHSATMVEVNCETDFVAKNSEFQGFVGQAAAATLQHLGNQQSELQDVKGVAKVCYYIWHLKYKCISEKVTPLLFNGTFPNLIRASPKTLPCILLDAFI